MADRSSLLFVENVHKSFGAEEVLKGVSLSLSKGEVLCIVGPSGCGKSTLLRCINGLEEVDTGQVYLSGSPIHGVRREDARRIRENIGVVFQHFNLFSHLTILDNVVLGPLKVKGESKEKAHKRAEEMLRKVGLGDKFRSYPIELSGGQQQRAAIARALAMEPELILFDEPTSALDPEMICEVLDVIRDLAEGGTTMIVVTHEMTFARQIASRIIFIEKGIILEDSPPSRFFSNQNHPRIKDFLMRLTRYHDLSGVQGRGDME